MKQDLKKHSGLFDFVSKHQFLTALILCALFSFVYIAVNGFKITGTNDDYCVFKVINGGNTAVPCLGYFFTSFCALIQPLFGVINVFMTLHELLCFFSLTAINYFFIAKLGAKKGLFYTAIFDAVFFSFIIVEIMYTYTAILTTTAGLLCLFYAGVYEKRGKVKIFQLICGFVLLLTGSQVRFEPSAVCCGMGAIYAAGVFLSRVLSRIKSDRFKKAAASALKKYAVTGVLLAAAFISVFGLNLASGAIKNSSEDYRELSQYYESLSSVNDSRNYPYYKNPEAFEAMGLKSAEDYYTLREWFVDDSFYTVERLDEMSAFIREDTLDGLLNKSIAKKVLYPFEDAFSQMIKSKFILVYLFILIIAVFGVVFFSILFPKAKWLLIKLALLAFIWSFFFMISNVFGIESILLLPLIAVSLLITVRYDRFQTVITLFLVAGLLIPYAYLVTIRLFFYTALAPIFPAFVLMIFGIHEEYAVKFEKRQRAGKITISVTAGLLAAVSVFTGVFVYINYVRIYDTECNPLMEEYIEDHPDTIFLINQTQLMKSYYHPFILSDDKTNVVNYGLWMTKAKVFKDEQKANGIDNIFKDAINSNMRIVICELDETNGDDSSGATVREIPSTHYLAAYYNNHYAEDGEVIEINQTDSAGSYHIFEVVSMPVSDE